MARAAAPGMDDMTAARALEIVKAADVSEARLVFSDLDGIPRTVWLPVTRLPDAIARGLVLDAASLGLGGARDGDLTICPDVATLRIWPEIGPHQRAALFVCDVARLDLSPSDMSCRGVLRRIVSEAAQRTWRSVVGAELEYYYLSRASDEPLDRGGYCATPSADVARAVRTATAALLGSIGLEVEYGLHECGPGQHEIVVGPSAPLKAADEILLRKLIIGEVAAEHGIRATFMPKPFDGEPGSGMHLHQSMFIGDEPAFYAEGAEGGLSQMGASYIAGQLRHAPACTILWASWVNSYKRLVALFPDGDVPSWEIEARTAMVRVPRATPASPAAYRIEVTTPDAACNPYLSIAATLAAGYDGMDERLPLGPRRSSPRGTDATAPPLPETLGDAIRVAAESEFLRRVMGEALCERWLAHKREQWRAHNARVHPSERGEMLGRV